MAMVHTHRMVASGKTPYAPMNVVNSATKPARPGKPSDARPAIMNTVAMNGMRAGQAAHHADLAGVGAVVDQADHAEQQPAVQAVRDHDQQRAVEADLASARRCPE